MKELLVTILIIAMFSAAIYTRQADLLEEIDRMGKIHTHQGNDVIIYKLIKEAK